MPPLSGHCAVTMSEWRPAPVRTDGWTVFAIGDVHGCAGQLAALLAATADMARPPARSRLVLLGDLICRGPSSLDALALWAAPERERAFTRVHRLSGNHEQLLMLAIGGGPVAAAAARTWMGIDGDTFLDEIRHKTERTDAPLTRDLVAEAAGAQVMARLDALETHVRIGNVVLVHGGVDPALGLDEALALPWDQFGGRHWAWIQEPFLSWRGGFGGAMIVHGHTPPPKHCAMSGYPDPHVFQHDRLSLDGGSSRSGIVAGAQIEDGRYRLLLAAPAAN